MAVETLLGTDGPAYLDVGRAVLALASGTTAVVAAVTGKKIRVLEYGLGSDATVTLTWKSATTAIAGPIPLTAGAQQNANFSPVGVFETAAGEALNAVLSGTANVGGWLNYVLI